MKNQKFFVSNNPLYSYRPIEVSENIENLRKKDAIKFHEKYKNEFKLRSCPSCGTQDSVRPDLTKYSGLYPVLKCARCTLVYVGVEPTETALADYYENAPSIKALNDFYKNRGTGNLVSNQRLNFVSSYCPVDVQDLRILEVGCGNGYFLKELKNKLKENYKSIGLYGVEPNKKSANYSRENGISVFEEFFQETNKESYGKYDLILGFELIEHLLEPGVFLRTIYEMLNPGGFFILTTPNIEGFGSIYSDYNGYRLTAHAISPPVHMQGFSRVSLALLAARANFSIEAIEAIGSFDVYEFIRCNEVEAVDEHYKDIYAAVFENSKNLNETSQGVQALINQCNASSALSAVFKRPL